MGIFETSLVLRVNRKAMPGRHFVEIVGLLASRCVAVALCAI